MSCSTRPLPGTDEQSRKAPTSGIYRCPVYKLLTRDGTPSGQALALRALPRAPGGRLHGLAAPRDQLRPTTIELVSTRVRLQLLRSSSALLLPPWGSSLIPRRHFPLNRSTRHRASRSDQRAAVPRDAAALAIYPPSPLRSPASSSSSQAAMTSAAVTVDRFFSLLRSLAQVMRCQTRLVI